MAAHSNAGAEHTKAGATAHASDAEGFHAYGVLWTPAELVWYYDDVAVARAATPADMHGPMDMLVNLASAAPPGSMPTGLPRLPKCASTISAPTRWTT